MEAKKIPEKVIFRKKYLLRPVLTALSSNDKTKSQFTPETWINKLIKMLGLSSYCYF